MKKLITLILVLALSVCTLASCGSGGAEIERGSGNPDEFGTGACEYDATRDISDREIVYVEMKIKNYGKVLLLLDRTTAPITVDNFVRLVNKGFYDGLTFHRVQENFVLQGGDPTSDGLPDSNEPTIEGEFGLNGHYNNIRHKKGVISMARLPSSYNSATTQFFICLENCEDSLDRQYASFGYVIKGLDIIDEIEADFVKYGDTQNMGMIKEIKDQPIIEYMKVVDYTPNK